MPVRTTFPLPHGMPANPMKHGTGAHPALPAPVRAAPPVLRLCSRLPHNHGERTG